MPSHMPNNPKYQRQSQFNPNFADNSSVYHTMETGSTNPTSCKYFDNKNPASSMVVGSSVYLYSNKSASECKGDGT